MSAYGPASRMALAGVQHTQHLDLDALADLVDDDVIRMADDQARAWSADRKAALRQAAK